jgi:hypothetical protein
MFRRVAVHVSGDEITIGNLTMKLIYQKRR